jgi:hypothetical protein
MVGGGKIVILRNRRSSGGPAEDRLIRFEATLVCQYLCFRHTEFIGCVKTCVFAANWDSAASFVPLFAGRPLHQAVMRRARPPGLPPEYRGTMTAAGREEPHTPVGGRKSICFMRYCSAPSPAPFDAVLAEGRSGHSHKKPARLPASDYARSINLASRVSRPRALVIHTSAKPGPVSANGRKPTQVPPRKL